MASGSPERDFGERSGDDHYILYTGGTTGMPKGVVWRQEDVFYALGGGIDAYTNERVASEWSLAEKAKAVETPDAVAQPAAAHARRRPVGLPALRLRGQLRRVAPQVRPARGVAHRRARGHQQPVSITGDAMARPMIEALEEMGGPDALDLSSLFVLASTAAIFSPTVKDQYLELFPNLMIIDAIGSLGDRVPTACAWSPRATRRTRAAGPRCRPARDTVVLDEDLNEIEPGTGVQGRLARRGNVPLEYYKDPRSRRPPSSPGPTGMRYALAGDMAILEADGTITLLGRGSQCINSGGEKIFPEEVEAALKAHPAVFDAIVVGVPDERWGQRVAAVVQPRDGAVAHRSTTSTPTAAATSPGYKVPKELHLVAEVVRSPSGKPDYPWAGKVARGEITV